jgi:hypothetical protein
MKSKDPVSRGFGEQRKLAILLGLCLIAGVVAYVRFGRRPERIAPSSSAGTGASLPATVAAAPTVDRRLIEIWQHPEIGREPLRPLKRNIFALGRRLRPEDAPPESPPEQDAITLGAIMAAGGDAVALINDRYARVGDRIGPYQIARIDLDRVTLESQNETRVVPLVE